MKNTFFKSTLFAAKINPTHVKFFFMLLMLALLVLGAGAPSDVGGVH
jgi:hypothetical protein